MFLEVPGAYLESSRSISVQHLQHVSVGPHFVFQGIFAACFRAYFRQCSFRWGQQCIFGGQSSGFGLEGETSDLGCGCG